MKDLRLIALTLTMAILLGAVSPQAGALAAEQGSTMQEEIEQKDGGSNAEHLGLSLGSNFQFIA